MIGRYPDFDVLDPHFYDDPWATYRWLRQESPIHWDERNQLWILSRHADVSHVSRHPERYSSAQGVRPRLDVPLSIIAMDDPEHTRQRRLINRGFTPRRVRAIGEHMRELTRGLLDDIAERGEVDFVEDFAIHLPLIIIAELMGLDPSQRDQLYRWSDAMMGGEGHTEPDDPALIAAATAFAEYSAMCSELIEARRGQPVTEDLISVLTNAYDEGALARGGDASSAGEGAADGPDAAGSSPATSRCSGTLSVRTRANSSRQQLRTSRNRYGRTSMWRSSRRSARCARRSASWTTSSTTAGRARSTWRA